jgi:hypothetical protein
MTGGGEINISNKILAKLYCNGELLLDTSIDHLNEYLYAIKNSDTITVHGRKYNLKNVELVHDTSNGLVIVLKIDLTEQINNPIKIRTFNDSI